MSSQGRSSLGYLRPYRAIILGGVASLVATNACFLGVAVYLKDSVQALKDARTIQSVSDSLSSFAIPRGYLDTLAAWRTSSMAATTHAALQAVGFLVLFAIFTAISRIASRVWIFNAARAAEYDLRSDLFGHAVALAPGYYRDHPTGDVMSRLTNDVQVVRAMWGAGLVHLANAVTSFATVLPFMLGMSWKVALLAVIPYPLIFFVGQLLSRRIYTSMREVQGELGSLSARIQEDLGAIQVIKTYGLEDLRRTGFVASSKRLLQKNMTAAIVRIQLTPTLNALASSAVAILIVMGGRAVIHSDLDVGQYTAFAALLARLVWPTLTLGFMLALVQRGRASWSRLVSLQDTQPEIVDGDGPPLVVPASGLPAHVDVTHLTIQIGERKLLDDVSFTLVPSTVTAIVGRTGAGKSTLVEALCRLIPIPAGMIAIDGRDLTTLPLDSVRAQIGYAPQEAFLFSTTIADNIAMGYGAGTAIPAARRIELERVGAAEQAPDLSSEPRVTDAADAAGLTRDLAVMPERLATVVGERGITLSGGQRQRVALARALAAKPRLLVLDDSLSSVDAETERVILANLRRVMKGRTAVLISHRVAAIKDADQILVIDQGKIVERGTHAELIRQQGVYSDLYRTQLDTEFEVVAERAG
ncbi:MAG: ABC transporter ATP-binding protein [Kofleriaceae bacterium]